MRPGSLVVRAVEYQVLPSGEVGTVGLNAAEVKEHLGDRADFAVVKCVCVDTTGERFTCVTDASYFKELLETGEASDPSGMALSPSNWLVAFRGWLRAS